MAEEKDQALLMIGQRFKQFRKERGITQDDLIEAVTPVVISRIENGHRMPNSELLVYMANKYAMDINWLLTGDAGKKSTTSSIEILARIGLLETRIREIEKDMGKELFK